MLAVVKRVRPFAKQFIESRPYVAPAEEPSTADEWLFFDAENWPDPNDATFRRPNGFPSNINRR
jgi:hypothetical protein